MIKIKNKILIESVGAISQMGLLLLPIPSIRPMAKTMRILQTELENVTVIQNAAIKGLPVKEENEKQKDFDKRVAEFKKEYEKQYAEFLETEIEIPVEKFSIDLLGADQRNFSAAALMTLDWLIEF